MYPPECPLLLVQHFQAIIVLKIEAKSNRRNCACRIVAVGLSPNLDNTCFGLEMYKHVNKMYKSVYSMFKMCKMYIKYITICKNA